MSSICRKHKDSVRHSRKLPDNALKRDPQLSNWDPSPEEDAYTTQLCISIMRYCCVLQGDKK